MSRPIEATSSLDLDTIKVLLWASEYGTGQPNVSRLYDRESVDGLTLSRGTFFNAVKGRKVTNHVIEKIDELIALRGWRSKWLDHCREEHRQRVIRAFGSPQAFCQVCGHACPNCGNPKTQRRREAVKAYLKIDPVDLGCRVVSDPEE